MPYFLAPPWLRPCRQTKAKKKRVNSIHLISSDKKLDANKLRIDFCCWPKFIQCDAVFACGFRFHTWHVFSTWWPRANERANAFCILIIRTPMLLMLTIHANSRSHFIFYTFPPYKHAIYFSMYHFYFLSFSCSQFCTTTNVRNVREFRSHRFIVFDVYLDGISTMCNISVHLFMLGRFEVSRKNIYATHNFKIKFISPLWSSKLHYVNEMSALKCVQRIRRRFHRRRFPEINSCGLDIYIGLGSFLSWFLCPGRRWRMGWGEGIKNMLKILRNAICIIYGEMFLELK